MKTWISPENIRYPERGSDCSLTLKNGIPVDVWIKGIGRKKITPKQATKWKFEDIPDLDIPEIHPPNLTIEDKRKVREYADKWGKSCAQEFMWTCTIMQGTELHNILNARISEEDEQWFMDTFKRNLYDFREAVGAVTGRFCFDIFKFEKEILIEGGYYKISDEVSMAFVVDKIWGAGTGERLKTLF